MSNEIYEEVMEQETSLEPTEVYDGIEEECETESKGGFGIAALVVGGVAAAAVGAVAVYKKLKDKKADKPKKPKTKWKLVKVPVETEVDVEDNDFEDEDVIETEE